MSRFDANFGKSAPGRGREPLISKFASSAAHVAGHKLTSSETGTWMAEHFCETLEELKCFVDRMFVSGINHVYYTSCIYSPDDAAWPGWLVYSATEMNPRNSIWHDVPTLNTYVARCQSILQGGQPDNDVLLYWPIHDFWHQSEGTLPQLNVHERDWFEKQPIGATARLLWNRGYGFEVSDRQDLSSDVPASNPVWPALSCSRRVCWSSRFGAWTGVPPRDSWWTIQGRCSFAGGMMADGIISLPIKDKSRSTVGLRWPAPPNPWRSWIP